MRESYPGEPKRLSIADHRRPNGQHTLLKTLKPFMHVRAILSVNEATAYIPGVALSGLQSLMEVAVPMLAEQLSQSAVEQRINNGYTGGCVEKTWGEEVVVSLLFVRLTALSDVLKRFLFISNIKFHLGE